MIKAQGRIFGWASCSDSFLEALVGLQVAEKT
jgi:hypothetical protein